ncbi:pre-mRNA-splicing factor 38A [Lepeophtheirus salmonis]|uniref:Pre-mRNA-splicing factor 38 n=1 Tax=Lepeophtheirus salmonis TaxID=72036 RepID=C1BSW5_LEPSM|nr:pre-mRNA-splicing factor 38A-like [Lepeophtheirus salmonis]ACO12118.1 Pre-mRNA-splicing factor 38A [Lepeophtheirus salmonis]
MANRTVKDATTIKGTNPQYLIEKVIRTRIYDSKYWKEQCFALTAELLVDKAMELRYIGGTFAGNIKPTPFLCLVLKMLQIQPEKDIVVEFIKNEDFKYVRALGAFYLRLVGSSLDCYKYLEPLLNDYRKIRVQDKQGKFNLSHMDEFVDTLLREERLCDTILPRIQIRSILEETQNLEPRVSILDEDLDEEIEESSSEEEEGILKDDEGDTKKHKSKRRRDSSSERYKSSRRRRRSRSVSRDRRRNRSRSRSRSPRRHDRRRDERSHHRRKESSQKSSSSNSYKSKGGADEMSIEETNKLRISLGLNPLK